MIREGARTAGDATIELYHAQVNIGYDEVVTDVTMQIGGTDFIGVVGPNGAGKTTLLRALAGLIDFEGLAQFGLRPLNGLTPRERAITMTYLPQDRQIAWPLAVRDVVALGRFTALHRPKASHGDDAQRVAEAIASCGLRGHEDRPVTELSGGQRSLVLLARALASDAPFLFADEPIASLDPAHQTQVMELLAARAKQGRPVVAVLHDITIAAVYCTRLAVLHYGRKIADGSPHSVLVKGALHKAFGVAFVRARMPDGSAITVVQHPPLEERRHGP
ncbi:MAG TPA: ABC transporter ATP-binding protein [Beijerinckiaceae bacterium]|jgi:iron complex transport system ATP-binding protein